MIITLVIFIAFLIIVSMNILMQEAIHCYKDDEGIIHVCVDTCVWVVEGSLLFIILGTLVVDYFASRFFSPVLCK